LEKHTTIIKPGSTFSIDLKELWQYRELLYFFTWRDIKVKYKQTALGILWAIIQPVSLMLLFTFIFSKNFNINTGGLSYEVFVFSGLLMWNLFYGGVANAAESILSQSTMIKKIYFPRILIPASSIIVSLFDFILALFVFLIFCLIMGQGLTWEMFILFPTSIILVIISSFGIGAFLSALNVRYRDFRYALPIMLQFLFFETQVVYSLRSIEQSWLKYLLAINPVNGAIEIFRSAFTGSLDVDCILISSISAIVFIATGIIYFKKSEAFLADLA
jgi:lipopolysaccharide transport system permease protein